MTHPQFRPLLPSDVPLGTRDWNVFARFALSFDGYSYAGDRCGDIANEAAEAYERGGSLPEALSDLRCCVFFEQRRWRHFGRRPDEDAWPYLDALLERIYEKLSAPSADV